MPMHKRESLIYTVLMCFTMVLWMSMYNVALHMGTLNMEVIRLAGIPAGICMRNVSGLVSGI